MKPPLVAVYTAAGRLQAHLIKNLLEAAGIPAELSQEGAGAAYGLTVGPLGWVEVLVAQSHAAQAEAVIAALDRGELEVNDEAPGDDAG